MSDSGKKGLVKTLPSPGLSWMQWVAVGLFVLFLLLQFRLWFGAASISSLSQLESEVEEQLEKNDRMDARRQALASEVEALKSGTEAIEARAREDLGLVKPGETFFLVTDE